MGSTADKHNDWRRHVKRSPVATDVHGKLFTASVLYRVGAPLGDALGRCAVAVAGTRNPTQPGRRLARTAGRRLAEAGYAVITGLARGIDEEATIGALEGGGRAVGVLPYLLEKDGKLNTRAAWLLRAASSNALASVVAENLVNDGRYVKTWLAVRNRIIVHMATALVVPEARFKPMRWGTRYAVEYALAARRLVILLEPRVESRDVVEAFEYFRRRGAMTTAKDADETLSIIERHRRPSRPAEH